MSGPEHIETTDVLVVGCGPIGAVFSALLGKLSIRNVVLEKEKEITSDPRAITIDEDAIRVLQELGLHNKVYTEIGTCIGVFHFVSGDHHDLSTPGFMSVDARTAEGPTTHVAYIAHKQPVLERCIRDILKGYPACELREDSEVISVRDDSEWVYVKYKKSTGEERTIRSRFLVGADGGRGFVRRQHLSQKGVRMEKVPGISYEETWVAMNWHLKLPTPESHPGFPLWSLGYTSEQVYDLFFPQGFRFLCNPARSAVCGRFGLLEDRCWRFEFALSEDEDGEKMSSPEMIEKIVMPYFRHPGKRYGVKTTVEYPKDCIEILRSSPFKFAARVCNQWAVGRVMVIGDAAHVFPPFGGQGLASGFRDASSLAWRLALSLKPGANYDSLLHAWYAERKQQLVRSIAMTVQNGQYVTERNWIKAKIRDWHLYAIQLFPGGRRMVESGGRAARGIRYRHEESMPFDPTSGGFLLPQVYCADISSRDSEDPLIHFTDDVIFSHNKTALFQIIVLLGSLEEYEEASSAIESIGKAPHSEVNLHETTFIIQSTDLQELAPPNLTHGLYRLATAEEFNNVKELSAGRPYPSFYDPLRMWKEVYRKRYIILRPDRLVFASSDSVEGLLHAIESIPEFVYTKQERSHNRTSKI